ncbi:3-hydroxyacyl-CoA dehydrogenase NAD-binding domain-containing protein [Limibacillus halophilus]|uniref:L-carnitine dehydrogenase n=1 Tax=Limibacillus halophilus TaxID=1579333 RepID=A0A839SYU1_9PROT|nr:3-hydroxyacyl-CoA dehydrogenase NAD-binding domain-containing protein [Limibacillus halophilus]MBB3066746.1 carnitine 3-dehydrogenase [Limibacillus halophilus]
MSVIGKAALLGGGVIGGGWAARLLLNGIDVVLFDPDPQAARKMGEVMTNARRAFADLIPEGRPSEGRLTITADLAEAVSGATFIQESAPERLELKQNLFAEVDALAPEDALICSSTSGLLPTELQAKMKRPERLLVAHPFNPVYLLPLVELVGGEKTAPEAIERAKTLYVSLGMKPLHVRREIEAFIADRLMEALWREALWLVKDGIASAEEIDDAIRYGCGLRWAQMGTFQVFNIAGGEAGMRHFMAQFGPALKWPWTKLMDVPEMTEELIERIAEQTDAQAGGRSFRELERIRDENLVAIMQALEPKDWGAGAVLKQYRAQLRGDKT